MGSDSDLKVMSKAAVMLEELGIEYEMTIISAHREPDELIEWTRGAEDRGIKVMIAGAGMAAILLMFLAPNLVFWVPIVAFIGAMGAAVLVFALAWNRGVQPLFLVLSGVAVSVFFGGGMILFVCDLDICRHI